ncbi:MAG: TetR family transcriptional regulator [Sneathiellaceae bacterium]
MPAGKAAAQAGRATKPRRKGERAPAVTRAALLEAGIQEFASAGFGGARTDRIAQRANSNERSLYYYFGSKQGLYVAALEHLYQRQAEAEQALELDRLDPRDALKALISFTWHYYQDNPEFLGLLATENLYKAAHLRESEAIRSIASPKMRILEDLLQRGIAAGLFRRDVTAGDLFLTFSGLLYFYLSNRWTLSNYLARDLDTVTARDGWLAHVTQLVLEYALRR